MKADDIGKETFDAIKVNARWIEDSLLAMKRLPLSEYAIDSVAASLVPYRSVDGLSICFSNEQKPDLESLKHLSIHPTLQQSTEIYITDYLSSEYAKAVSFNCVVGTMAWLDLCLASNALTDPALNALHSPYPRTPIPEFTSLSFTISGFHKKPRADLIRMIELMGAHFTGSMSKNTTHLCCALRDGDKFLNCDKWGVKVVSSGWIEKCFMRWKVCDVEWFTSGDVGSVTMMRMIEGGEFVADDKVDELSKKRSSSSTVSKSVKKQKSQSTNEESIVFEPDSYVEEKHQKTPVVKASKPRSKSLPMVPKPKIALVTDERDTSRESPQKKLAYKIMFTGFKASKSELAALAKINCHVATDISTCTLLVSPRISRTLKLLVAINNCIPIVNPSYIRDSIHAGKLLEPLAYLVSDRKAEKMYGFSYKERITARGVFDGYTFFFLEGCKVGNELLERVVESGGGDVVGKRGKGCIVVGDKQNAAGVRGTVHAVESIFTSSLRGSFVKGEFVL